MVREAPFATNSCCSHSDGHPWGTAVLDSGLVSSQPYDVHVEVELPRTPSNLDTGNFMLDLTLFSHSSTSAQTGENTTAPPISRSRRPAILTYTSPLIDIASKISFMPLYVLGWKQEAERLVVRMMEGVEFSRGAHNIPETLRLELNSKEEMQVYSAKVTFRTRFTGIRYAFLGLPLTFEYVYLMNSQVDYVPVEDAIFLHLQLHVLGCLYALFLPLLGYPRLFV